MVTAQAIIHGDRQKLLGFNDCEHPVALQLGGSDPALLAHAAKIGRDWGYDEINLNCGCPSDRVQSGSFGACLMAMPVTVADCVKAMRDAVDCPVTVKTRLGIDEQDSYEFVCDFVDQVAAAGCDVFIMHARIAWLKGLSPRENREKPPLQYEKVYQLKRDFPQLTIALNGGLETVLVCEAALAQGLDGVMLGRAAYHNPWILAELQQALFPDIVTMPTEAEVLAKWREYLLQQIEQGVALSSMTRHILGMFHGRKGARSWRRILTEEAGKNPTDITVFDRALSAIQN